MDAPIVVTGGTGRIGRRVVERIVAQDRSARVLTRHPRAAGGGVTHVGGDTRRGIGLDAGFAGAEVVVHLAGGASGDDVAAGHVARAARAAGVGHLVLVSVIGADRMPLGYFRAKAAAETAFGESGVPYTLLRIAQVHDLVLPLVRFFGAGPVAIVPRGVRCEPLDVNTAADAVADAALGAPGGRLPDLVGPEMLTIPDLVQQRATEYGKPRRSILSFPVPGAVGAAYRDGANLAGRDARRAGPTWSAFLHAERLRLASRSPAA